jgi:hypothetical protein
MSEQAIETEYWDPYHNELCDGGVTVAQFQTGEECEFAAYRLRERGIRSGVLLPQARLDLRWPQVRVSPDDEQVAGDVLAQPVTTAERAEYYSEPEGESFSPPCCPRCKSCEVVLEIVGNGNNWRCETCGASWVEVPSVTDD